MWYYPYSNHQCVLMYIQKHYYNLPFVTGCTRTEGDHIVSLSTKWVQAQVTFHDPLFKLHEASQSLFPSAHQNKLNTASWFGWQNHIIPSSCHWPEHHYLTALGTKKLDSKFSVLPHLIEKFSMLLSDRLTSSYICDHCIYKYIQYVYVIGCVNLLAALTNWFGSLTVKNSMYQLLQVSHRQTLSDNTCWRKNTPILVKMVKDLLMAWPCHHNDLYWQDKNVSEWLICFGQGEKLPREIR